MVVRVRRTRIKMSWLGLGLVLGIVLILEG